MRGQRCVEDVGDVGERRKRLRDGGGVGEVQLEVGGVVVGGDRGGGGPGRERAAGERVDLPWPAGRVGEREDVHEGGTYYAGGADDEGDAPELPVLVVFVLRQRMGQAGRAPPPPAAHRARTSRPPGRGK